MPAEHLKQHILDLLESRFVETQASANLTARRLQHLDAELQVADHEVAFAWDRLQYVRFQLSANNLTLPLRGIGKEEEEDGNEDANVDADQTVEFLWDIFNHVQAQPHVAPPTAAQFRSAVHVVLRSRAVNTQRDFGEVNKKANSLRVAALNARAALRLTRSAALAAGKELSAVRTAWEQNPMVGVRGVADILDWAELRHEAFLRALSSAANSQSQSIELDPTKLFTASEESPAYKAKATDCAVSPSERSKADSFIVPVPEPNMHPKNKKFRGAQRRPPSMEEDPPAHDQHTPETTLPFAKCALVTPSQNAPRAVHRYSHSFGGHRPSLAHTMKLVMHLMRPCTMIDLRRRISWGRPGSPQHNHSGAEELRNIRMHTDAMLIGEEERPKTRRTRVRGRRLGRRKRDQAYHDEPMIFEFSA